MLTIFANMRINEPERLQHMKDSFMSFNTISDDWIINIRGDLREEAIDFLRQNLGNKMTLFELLDDSRGWITNALEMLPKARYDYVFVWNEDHVNIAKQEDIKNVAKEMIDNDLDYLLPGFYSFWRRKIDRVRDQDIDIIGGEYIDIVTLTKKNINKFFPVQEKEKRECIITGAAIFQRDFLRKLMKFEQHKLPMVFTRYLYRFMTAMNMAGIKFNQRLGYDFIGKILFYKLRRFPKETPFELEITNDRHYVLPIKLGVPKKELFVCIDDDLSRDGYSLIKRGLYPLNFDLDVLSGEQSEENDDYIVKRISLMRNQEIVERCYDDNVRSELMKKTIILINGSLRVGVCGKEVVLAPGDGVSVYTNLQHSIKAFEDSVFFVVFSGYKNRKIKQV